MSATFFGINTALRGLEAQQAAIDVTAHNISNASTPGYSRQTARMETTDPVSDPIVLPIGTGQLGSGVQVTSIQRSHDDFVQQQIVYQNQTQAHQQTLSDTLDQVSQVFNEPGAQGFNTLLNSYFTSWQRLANNPSDAPTRAQVIARGTALASGFASTAGSLKAIQGDLNQNVDLLVAQINTTTAQIAGLNQQITRVAATGQQPNDLRDKRDLLVTQLSKLANIQYTSQPDGSVNVSLVGGGSLVNGITTTQLATTPDAATGLSQVVMQGTTTPLALTGGQLGGTLAARDTTVAGRLTALDTVAKNVADAVNAYQSTGYGADGSTGVPFFTGSTAATLAVNPAILNNPAKLAAAAGPNTPGDGSQALAIAQLQEKPPAGGTVTLQAQYGTVISQLGVEQQQARSNVQTGQLVLQHLTAQQSSVSAVSLNEEASNLMQYQSAYQAAARVISLMNQSINDMIQALGSRV